MWLVGRGAELLVAELLVVEGRHRPEASRAWRPNRKRVRGHVDISVGGGVSTDHVPPTTELVSGVPRRASSSSLNHGSIRIQVIVVSVARRLLSMLVGG